MIWKLAIIIAVALSSMFLIPQVFKFNEGSTALVQNSATIEPNQTTNQTSILPELNPKGFMEWLIDIFSRATSFLGNIITKYIKEILPTASGMLGTLILAMLALVIIYLKAESVSSIIRIAAIVGIGILAIALTLALMGLI